LAVPSVVASGGFSEASIYLVQVLFRNEVECRASGSSTCAHLYVGVDGHPHPSQGSPATQHRVQADRVRHCWTHRTRDEAANRRLAWRLVKLVVRLVGVFRTKLRCCI
jgi:hypothetical protein